MQASWDLVAVSCLYGVLIVATVFQIGRILYYRHKLVSFQVGFLVLCFFWMALRIGACVALVCLWDNYPDWAYIALFSLPANLEFATFSLLVLFYASVIKKNLDKQQWEKGHRVGFTVAFTVSNIAFLCIQIAWIAYVLVELGVLSPAQFDVEFNRLQTIRAAYTAVAFALLTVLLSIYSFRLKSVLSSGQGSMPFQAKATSNTQVLGLTFTLLFLFFTRSLFDVLTAATSKVSIIFGPGGTSGDHVWFFITSLAWEIVPTFLVLMFFRSIPRTKVPMSFGRSKFVNKRPYSYAPINVEPPQGSPLFANPNRYDSDEENTGVTPASPAMYGTPGYYYAGASPASMHGTPPYSTFSRHSSSAQ
jgi:hypothetical protein